MMLKVKELGNEMILHNRNFEGEAKHPIWMMMLWIGSKNEEIGADHEGKTLFINGSEWWCNKYSSI